MATKYYTVNEVENLARQHQSYHRAYLVQLGENGHFFLRKMYREAGSSWKVEVEPIAASVVILGENNVPAHAFNVAEIKFN